VAVIVAEVFLATPDVVNVNLAIEAPPPTLTEDGGVAQEFEDVSATVRPLEPAFLESVTVPVIDAPPTTEVGESESLLTVCATAEPDTPKANTQEAENDASLDNGLILPLGRKTKRRKGTASAVFAIELRNAPGDEESSRTFVINECGDHADNFGEKTRLF